MLAGVPITARPRAAVAGRRVGWFRWRRGGNGATCTPRVRLQTPAGIGDGGFQARTIVLFDGVVAERAVEGVQRAVVTSGALGVVVQIPKVVLELDHNLVAFVVLTHLELLVAEPALREASRDTDG